MTALKLNDKPEILYPIFVETGTYKGETILKMEKKFRELYIIEIKKQYFNNVKNKYNGNKINFYNGDSSILLSNIVDKLTDNTIFFLDGHWSAGNTGKGTKHVPLYEEINDIVSKFKYNGIIIIDDFRLFGTGPNTTNRKTLCNWEDISKEKILNIVRNRLEMEYHLPSSLHNKDRFIIHLGKLDS